MKDDDEGIGKRIVILLVDSTQKQRKHFVFLSSICNRWYLRGRSQLSSRDKLFTSLVFQLWWFAPQMAFGLSL